MPQRDSTQGGLAAEGTSEEQSYKKSPSPNRTYSLCDMEHAGGGQLE